MKSMMTNNINNRPSMKNASFTVRNETASNSMGIQGILSKNKTKQKTKQLNYNSREISSQLLRASKVRNASIVLIRAKTKVGVLKRCLGTGQYNDREVLAAVVHAQRMVNCAQLKVRNLKEEEQLKHKNEKEQAESKQQRKNEVKRRVSQKEQALKSKLAMEEMQQARKEKKKRQELCRKRKLHRNQEYGKITEADMKYLKDRTENGGYSVRPDYSGVSLELSNAAMSLSELQLSAKAMQMTEQQIEQEIEMQVELQMQAEGISSAAFSAADTGSMQGMAAAESTASAGTFDVSI